MTSKYIAENGTEITDELVDEWAEEAENGFPAHGSRRSRRARGRSAPSELNGQVSPSS